MNEDENIIQKCKYLQSLIKLESAKYNSCN